MRVGLLTPGYGEHQGTPSRYVQALARGATQAGASVKLLENAAGWRYLWEHVEEFDVVHAHGEATLPALFAVRDSLRHLVITPHWYAAPQTNLRRMVQGRVHRLDGPLLARAERVLCVSEAEALQVRRHAPTARIEIVPNGLDTNSIARARPFPTESRVILSVDRLTRWAGIHRVISAMLALPPSYRLVVVGNGRARAQLEAHADYLGVADRVRFLGAVDDSELHRWMRTAAVVATLKEESLWSATVLTALCAGTPVVASDIAANREAVELTGGEGIGFVSRRASPFAIAEAIRQLADAGSRPRESLVPTWEDTATRVVSLYRELVRQEEPLRAHHEDSLRLKVA
jgi:glycosyltransferase involved in cell wall biosynthesis